MIVSAFEGLLVPERVRRKAAREGGFAVPVFQERVVDDCGPFLASNAKGSFLQPTLSSDNRIRYGFSECPIDQEANLLVEYLRVLWDISSRFSWSNRCSGLAQAHRLLGVSGYEPRTLLVSRAKVSKIGGEQLAEEDVAKIILGQGHLTEVEGVRVLPVSIPEEWMLLATAAPLVGFYTRVDNYLGLLFQRINQTVVLIREDGLAR